MVLFILVFLGLRFFVGAEDGSGVSQVAPNVLCERVPATEHVPCDPSRVLERRHGFAEIVERRSFGSMERLRVKSPRLERKSMSLSENASFHRDRSAQQCLGFFEAF